MVSSKGRGQRGCVNSRCLSVRLWLDIWGLVCYGKKIDQMCFYTFSSRILYFEKRVGVVELTVISKLL